MDSRFIDTLDGMVNLRHVACIKSVSAPHSHFERYLLYNRDGKILGTRSSALFDPVADTAPLISAAAGLIAVVITVAPEPFGRRPEAQDVWVGREIIIGWRLEQDYASPVLVDSRSSNQVVLIEKPDGSLAIPGDCHYANLDEARPAVRSGFQRNWDRRHGDAA